MVQLLPYMVENIVGKRENVLYQTTKNLDRSTLKAIADDKINVNKKLKFDMGRVENIVGKGENAGYQHFLLFPTMFSKGFFLLFPQCFQKASSPFPTMFSKGFFLRLVKSLDCVAKG